VQSFVLPQQLGEMMIIRAGIPGAGQGADPRADALGVTSRGRATAVSMRQRGEPPCPQGGQEPKDVAHGQLQKRRCRSGGEHPRLDTSEDMGTMLFCRGQGNRLPVHPPRVTESLNC